MRQKPCRRLEELEKTSAAMRRATAQSNGSSGEKILAILGAHNFQRQPQESLLETFARFLGISPRELRNRLWERAYGNR